MGDMRNSYKILMGKSERKRSLGRKERCRVRIQWWALVNTVINLVVSLLH
jgi:hypothetical protein